MECNKSIFCFYVVALLALPSGNSFVPTRTTYPLKGSFHKCYQYTSTAATDVLFNAGEIRNPITAVNGKLCDESESPPLQSQNFHRQKALSSPLHRRDLFGRMITTTSSILATVAATPTTVHAAAVQNQVYTRVRSDKQGKKFGFTLSVSPSMEPSNKPLQTHMDEVNLVYPEIRGYQYGITVDMIRLKNLRDFGTPEEVAAKIVMAEMRRDGILDVTMASDPSEDAGTGAYDVEYISDGTRGKKHYITRTVVKDGKLFVLTAQVKEANLEDGQVKEVDVWDTVKSFRVLGVDEM